MDSTPDSHASRTLRALLALLALSAMAPACSKENAAVGEDKSREQPPGSSQPTGGGVNGKGVTPRSDQKMIPGLDQGHTPGSADTTVPLTPGVPPLDDAGAAHMPGSTSAPARR